MTTPFDAHALKGPYKSLVSWFGVQLVLSIASRSVASNQTLSAVVGLGILVTIVMLCIYAYRTANALGSGVPWLWSLAIFVPCVNIITLLVLSSKATTACKQAGIPVGLFGPKI